MLNHFLVLEQGFKDQAGRQQALQVVSRKMRGKNARGFSARRRPASNMQTRWLHSPDLQL